MKNLKISFKGNTSLVYVSMFKENIIDKINSVDPDTFNISDLNEFSHCEIKAGLGLGAYKDEECFVPITRITGETTILDRDMCGMCLQYC